MAEVTPTQFRRDLFSFLDAALDGETVVVRRNGRRLVLREEPEDAEAVWLREHRARMKAFWASTPPHGPSGYEEEDIYRSDHWEWSPDKFDLDPEWERFTSIRTSSFGRSNVVSGV